MFKNYFKTAWRNLFRNKGFSITNILGLTIGMACAIFILLWVYDELTYDKFQKNYDNIYQGIANRNFNNQVFTDRNMALPLASALESGLPQVKHAVVTTQQQSHIISIGDKKLKLNSYTVSADYFKMFTYKFIRGSEATAIPDAYSIVLTKSAAKSLFGDANPINKVVKVDNDYNAKISAVIEDVPGNSTFQFDYIDAFILRKGQNRELLN